MILAEEKHLLSVMDALVVLRCRGGGGDPVRGLLLGRSHALFPEYLFEDEAAGLRENELVVARASAEGFNVARVEPRCVEIHRYLSGAKVALVTFDPPLPYGPLPRPADEVVAALVLAMTPPGEGEGERERRRQAFWARAVELGLVPDRTDAELGRDMDEVTRLTIGLYQPVISVHDEEEDGSRAPGFDWPSLDFIRPPWH